MPSIIEAEFCHLNLDIRTPSVQREFQERLMDDLEANLEGINDVSQRSETVVRFFDDNDFLAALVCEYERVARIAHDVSEVLKTRRRLRRRLESRRRRLDQTAQRLEYDVFDVAWGMVVNIGRQKGPILIRCSKGNFRRVRANEIHELCESVQKAKGARVYVIESDDLPVDQKMVLAHSA